jgi:hypothetical protein
VHRAEPKATTNQKVTPSFEKSHPIIPNGFLFHLSPNFISDPRMEQKMSVPVKANRKNQGDPDNVVPRRYQATPQPVN